MHRRRNQVTIAAVAFVLGLLVVVQLRTQQSGAAFAGLSSQDLTVLVANLNARNDQLRREAANLQRELATLTANADRGDASIDELRADLRRVRLYAGLDPAVGQGVAVIIRGPVDAASIEDLLNELRNAGAEALAVDDIRITHRSVAVQGPTSLLVDGMPVGRRFTLRAIGSPDGLLSTIERPGGIIPQLEQFIDASIVASQADDLELPATRTDLTPRVAQPDE
jgi:uncharacterized protein YlxW (UPF0749 family)